MQQSDLTFATGGVKVDAGRHHSPTSLLTVREEEETVTVTSHSLTSLQLWKEKE